MDILKVLRCHPDLFFRLSGIRPVDFDNLVKRMHPIWLEVEHHRLSGRKRKRGIGAGGRYCLEFETQLLICLIYYRTYTTHVFLGLLFGVSPPTVSRTNGAITRLLTRYFRMPEREVRLSEEEKNKLLCLNNGRNRTYGTYRMYGTYGTYRTYGRFCMSVKKPHQVQEGLFLFGIILRLSCIKLSPIISVL